MKNKHKSFKAMDNMNLGLNNTPDLVSEVKQSIEMKNVSNESNKSDDYVTYARYKVIRNKIGLITNMRFIFANQKMKNIIGVDPVGLLRSKFLPMNEKICKYAQNALDIGIAKHFSYNSDVSGFEYIEGIIEPDFENDIIHVYTVDIHLLKMNGNEQNLRNNTSTILSMFNVTLLHWNIKEHYIYSDSILTTDFLKNNPNLYVGNTIRSSYTLYKITDLHLRHEIEEMVEGLKNGKFKFLSFSVMVRNSIKEEIIVKVNVIPEELENMYLIGIQY